MKKKSIRILITLCVVMNFIMMDAFSQELKDIRPPEGVGKRGADIDVKPHGTPGAKGEEGGIEEKVEKREKEEIEDTVPVPYTRSVRLPKIDVSEDPSRLELLFLGKIDERAQVLEQFGYNLFKPAVPEKEEMLDVEEIKEGEALDLDKEVEKKVKKAIEKQKDLLSIIPPTGFDKNYILAPGDEIQIFLSGEGVNIYLAKTKNVEERVFLPLFSLPIDPEGKIYYPPIGTVYLWGKSIDEAEAFLKAGLEKYIKDIEVSISLRKVRRFPVFVVGEVKTPGTVYVNALSSVIDALSLAEGVKKSGSLRTITVHRNDVVVSELDIYDLLIYGKRKADILLKDRDVIVVPPIGRTAGVWGMVKRPAIFEIMDGETVSDLLAFAGGVLPGANTFSMKLTTHLSDGKKVVREVEMDRAEIEPGDGDVFTVIPLADELKEFVELKGHVKNPGFYQWRKGMRINEIIESQDAFLPEGMFDYGEIIRRVPPDYSPRLVSFNPLEALAGNPEDNIELMAGDMVTLFSVWDFKKRPFVRIEGEIENPGRYRWVKGMTVRDLVRGSGGLTRASRTDEGELWRYELEDKNYILQFKHKLDLAKTLEGTEEENPELLPFDQVVIKGIGSYEQLIWKTTVKGEVASPGAFPIKRGDRISDLIERAGGMTKFAYPRGIVLLRKSVEELQRNRLQVLLTELESSLFKEEASSALGAETGEIALRKQVLESRKELLRVMREKMELVVGRVVVSLSKDIEELKNSDKDLELENGDQLFIPSVPSYVLMIGDVFNQVGLTYKSAHKLSEYLYEVGGLTRNADKKGIYVIRADGTVVSNEMNEFIDMVRWDRTRKRFSVGGIYTEQIYPGDTIVVPTETKFPIPWRPLIKDITQIIFQTLSTVAIINNL